MRALLIVDIQNDFIPGGTLAVPKGDEIVSTIDKLLTKKWDLVVASKDWHPKDHVSFAENHGKKEGEVIEKEGIVQILWPVHCVQETSGSAFAKGWDHSRVDKVIYKGVDRDIDSYSAFFDNGHLRETGLKEYLDSKAIHRLFVAGLATDYCVLYTVMDALLLGYEVYVVADACRSIELKPGDGEKALDLMQQHGAHIIPSELLVTG